MKIATRGRTPEKEAAGPDRRIVRGDPGPSAIARMNTMQIVVWILTAVEIQRVGGTPALETPKIDAWIRPARPRDVARPSRGALRRRNVAPRIVEVAAAERGRTKRKAPNVARVPMIDATVPAVNNAVVFLAAMKLDPEDKNVAEINVIPVTAAVMTAAAMTGRIEAAAIVQNVEEDRLGVMIESRSTRPS